MTENPPTGERAVLSSTSVSPEEPQRSNLTERFNIPPAGFAILSLGIIFVLYQIVGGGITILLFGTKITFQNVQWVRLATMVGQILLLFVPTLLLARLQTKNIAETFRWRPARLQEIFLAVLGVFSLQQLLQIYLYFQEKIPVPESIRPFVEELRRIIEETYRVLVTSYSVPEFLFVILVVALVPAFCEELLFRGLVQKNFERGTKAFWAVVITGVIFGAYHFNPFTFLPLAVLGMYFGFLVYRSNSILVSIAAHFFNNFTSVLAVFLKIGDNAFIEGTSSEMNPLILIPSLIFLIAIFLYSFLVFLRVTQQNIQ